MTIRFDDVKYANFQTLSSRVNDSKSRWYNKAAVTYNGTNYRGNLEVEIYPSDGKDMMQAFMKEMVENFVL